MASHPGRSRRPRHGARDDRGRAGGERCAARAAHDRLAFLSPAIRARIRVDGGWPEIDRSFRSSDQRIFFLGYAAEGRFGPISRFVLGTGFTSPRAASVLA
jgi:hypothetical protein